MYVYSCIYRNMLLDTIFQFDLKPWGSKTQRWLRTVRPPLTQGNGDVCPGSRRGKPPGPDPCHRRGHCRGGGPVRSHRLGSFSCRCVAAPPWAANRRWDSCEVAEAVPDNAAERPWWGCRGSWEEAEDVPAAAAERTWWGSRASWKEAEAVPEANAERPWRVSESHASSSAAPATAAIPPDSRRRRHAWSAEEA